MRTFSFRIRLCALALSALTAAVITATALSPASGTGPEGVTSFSGTSSGAIVTSHNSGTGQAISASGSTGASTGVIYATTSAAGSTAIRGYASSISVTPSYGVIGVSKNAYGVEALTYSPSSLALFAQNAAVSGGAIRGQSAGNAITGTSTKANGVVGQVSASPTPMPSAQFAIAGVLGQDLSTNYNANAGVAGTSTFGDGVIGVSSRLFGEGVAARGIGDAYGIFAQSSTRAAVLAYGLGTSSSCSTTCAALSLAAPNGAPVIAAEGSGYAAVMLLDGSGNLKIKGTLTASTTPFVIQRTASNVGVGTYATQQSVPSIEDFGEAQLVNGQAYVRIDRTLAAATERGPNYLVFITPQGEPRAVLYVTQKTPYGFAVRESAGGHSTLAFDYRIVAKPLSAKAPRLPVVAIPFGSGWQSAFKLRR